MNAYELADEIDSIAKDWLGQEKSGKLANMLRQQADIIAELEKRKWSEQDIKNACISARFSEEDFFRIKAYLPVYSSPQRKPLSDEEIKEVANNIVVPMSLDYDWRIAFARAILRKAWD